MQVLSMLGKQIAEIWKQFGVNQKVSIVLAILVTLGLIGGVMYWSVQPDFRLLYSGLSLKDASAMREKIEEAKIPLEVRDSGSALYVPASDVYRARLLLAAEGLPKDTSSGFELFEQPKFGLTDFAQQINYQRALQGELERTLVAMDNIDSARVSLALPKDKLFASDGEQKASASIMINASSAISQVQVRSISHIVASAVRGLDPSAVAIVDQRGRTLAAPHGDEEDQLAQASDQLDVQKNFAARIAQNAQSVLDAFLGKNNSVVTVHPELDFDRIEQRNEKYDAEGRVVRSERIISESTSKPELGGGGAAGVFQNTPVGSPQETTLETAMSKSKKENIQTEYLVPSGVERVVRTGARLKRLSVSCAIAEGESERSPDELQEIEALVKAAVGFVPGRDSVEVKEMRFVREAPVSAPWFQELPFDVNSLLRGVGLTGMILVILLVGRRMINSASVKSVEVGVPLKSVGAAQSEGKLAEARAGSGKEVDVDLFETLQSVKEDPKKAAAWIARSMEVS